MAERRRRGHGEGSIYQLPNGRWRGLVDAGWVDGKRRRRAITRPTRAAVVSELRALTAAAESASLRSTRPPTLSQWLERYLTEVAAPKVRPSTLSRYEQETRLHLVPTLGAMRLDKLQPHHLADLYRSRSDALSPASIRRLHAFLRRSLTVAVRWGLLEKNPALMVDPPPMSESNIRPLSSAEAVRFVSYVREHRLEARWLIGIMLGLRQGEVLGLRWVDVDLNAREIHVNGALQRRAHGELVFTATKTRRSVRTVPVTTQIARALVSWRRTQDAERAAAGPLWERTGFVFTTATGRPINARNDYRAFRGLLKNADLRRVRLHDLRHTAASRMLAEGVPARVVMELLGHSQISVTLNTYTHVESTLTADAVDRVGRAYQREADDE